MNLAERRRIVTMTNVQVGTSRKSCAVRDLLEQIERNIM